MTGRQTKASWIRRLAARVRGRIGGFAAPVEYVVNTHDWDTKMETLRLLNHPGDKNNWPYRG